jgi:hypothetical protein
VKRESVKEETLAPHSKGLSTKAVDNPTIKCAEVKILTPNGYASRRKNTGLHFLVGEHAVVGEHADMGQGVVDA